MKEKRKTIKCKQRMKGSSRVVMLILALAFVITLIPAADIQAAGNVTLENGYINSPAGAVKDGDKLYVYLGGKGVYEYDLTTGKKALLFKAKTSVARLFKHKEYIYLSATKRKGYRDYYSLVAYNLNTKKSKTLVKNANSAYVYNGSIYFSKGDGNKSKSYRMNYKGKKKKLYKGKLPYSTDVIEMRPENGVTVKQQSGFQVTAGGKKKTYTCSNNKGKAVISVTSGKKTEKLGTFKYNSSDSMNSMQIVAVYKDYLLFSKSIHKKSKYNGTLYLMNLNDKSFVKLGTFTFDSPKEYAL